MESKRNRHRWRSSIEKRKTVYERGKNNQNDDDK